MVIMGKLGNLLDLSCSNRKSSENGKNVSTFLHGNDSKLVLFIDPYKESLFVIVEDTSAIWPFSVEAA